MSLLGPCRCGRLHEEHIGHVGRAIVECPEFAAFAAWFWAALDKTGGEDACCPGAKLTEQDVRAIRFVLVHESARRLAGKYGVSASAIDHVRQGLTWTHVSGAAQ